jgi:UDP-N-acetylmuramoyl-tripeptide--D-alanyl-D-alanine ligase
MMSLSETLTALGARMLPAGPTGAAMQHRRYASVSTDSRTLERDALFVALRGERFDGHQFLDAVRGRGAAGALIDEQAAAAMAARTAGESVDLPLLVVGDTRRELGRLAAHWRARFNIPLVAVSGSNGKTTVKEMTAAILRAHYGSAATLATSGNLNNDIGLPLTLLRLRAQHACAVIEVGMNHPGETRELAAIARPTVALVNNAQREHQEFMAGVEEVAREHGALFQALPTGGTAVINADDAFAEYWRGLARSAGCRLRDFGTARGLDTAAAVRAQCRPRAFGSDIELVTPEGRVSFSVQVAGEHNARNAVAAAAAATAAGASLAAVAAGLSAFAPVKGRLERKAGQGGCVVIDDTYNANPDSVRAAIDALAQAAPGGRRVLALGDMGEVGAQGPAFHAEIGAYARHCGVAQLLAVGALCAHAVAAFGEGARHFDGVEDLAEALRGFDIAGNTVLIKGSRFMRMERAVRALTGENI